MTSIRQHFAVLADRFRQRNGYKFPRLGLLANRFFFRLMPSTVTTELLPGIIATLDLRDTLQRTTYWQGPRFEHPMPAVLARWGMNATAFFDIGANYGFVSYWMATNCPELEIYPFEPNPVNVSFMEDVKRSNGLHRLHPQSLGLSDRKESLDLTVARDDSAASTFGPHPGLLEATRVEADVLPFDQWVASNDLQAPDRPLWLAKIDVEGYEPVVLRGMIESLRKNVFAGIVVEVNPFTLSFCQSGPNDILDILRDCGYMLSTDPMCENEMTGKPVNLFFVPRV